MLYWGLRRCKSLYKKYNIYHPKFHLDALQLEFQFPCFFASKLLQSFKNQIKSAKTYTTNLSTTSFPILPIDQPVPIFRSKSIKQKQKFLVSEKDGITSQKMHQTSLFLSFSKAVSQNQIHNSTCPPTYVCRKYHFLINKQ